MVQVAPAEAPAADDDATGPWQTVTGTFATTDRGLIDLKLVGIDEPIGVTPGHLIWSADRGGWTAAGRLHPGERVTTLAPAESAGSRERVPSTLTVEWLRQRAGTETVYNLEINGRHAYTVGAGAVVVHNACPDNPFTNLTVEGREVPIQRVPGPPNRQMIKKWEEREGRQWPTDPATGKPQDVSHTIPLADGGKQSLPNIRPEPHREHMDRHSQNGDFSRWAQRRRRAD